MSVFVQNSFSSYDLSDEDSLKGSILTFLQQQVFQNKLALLAEEKISLEYSPEHPLEFLQQEAYKKGQLDFAKSILADSEAAKQELLFVEQKEMRL